MKQRQIKIRLKLEEVKDFVTVASKCDFDVDVFYNRFVVDAKSIVGVLGLDLNRILTVSYSGYNPEFEKMINRLAKAVGKEGRDLLPPFVGKRGNRPHGTCLCKVKRVYKN